MDITSVLDQEICFFQSTVVDGYNKSAQPPASTVRFAYNLQLDSETPALHRAITTLRSSRSISLTRRC